MAKKKAKPGDVNPDEVSRGRPSRFTRVIADKICVRLAMGESLRRICQDEDFPAESTVRAWALDDLHGFYAQYTRARNIGLDAMADETLELADKPQIGEKTIDDPQKGLKVITGDTVERSRLRVETRKWYLSKLAPKRYGERQVEGPRDGESDPLKDLIGEFRARDKKINGET